MRPTGAVRSEPNRAASCTVEPVRTAADRDRFIAFEAEVNRGDPHFVPPIVAERRDFLDARKNPFLAYAQVQLYLARREGRVVGRIAAIDDPHYNQFHDTELGFFGLFECIDDAGVAGELFDAAAGWIRARKLKRMLGPVNMSLNHDCGLLVDGFHEPPAMMMPYNPRYYAALFEANQLAKKKDLWSYELFTAAEAPERVIRIAQRLRERDGVRVRSLRVNEPAEEARRIKRVYDAMLDRRFGFVPMTDAEFEAAVLRFRPLVQVRPELCLIAEVGDEPVAFSLTLPDANVALKAADGHLTRFGLPIGLMKIAWTARRIDRLRVLMLGVKPGFRRRGIDALLYVETLHRARDLGYVRAELGWTTEDDTLLNRGIGLMGGRHYKTYRLYERAI